MIFVDADSLSADERKVHEAVVLLRQLARVPVLIFARGDTSAEVVESLWRAGADDLIMKPVRMRQVSARLAAIAAAATVPKVERRNMRVLLFLTPDETMRREYGPLLELEGFQLTYATADEVGLASISPTARFDCLAIAGRGASHEVATVRARLTARRLDLAAVPTVLISASPPVAPAEPAHVKWLKSAVGSPETAVAALNSLLKRSSTTLQAHARVPFFCLVEFRDTAAPCEPWSASFSFDLSPMGIFLKTLLPARPGTTIEFKIHLTTTREEMLGTGVVAWANTFADRKAFACPVGMGVQFLGMSPKPLSKLREICRIASS